MHFSNNKSVNN